tara:strand:- start:8390 stop:10036 length:1647 start_codon:yes stop_codon:yes gene_type:complete
MSEFRTQLGADIFAQKYANYEGQTWSEKATMLAEIARPYTNSCEFINISNVIRKMQFLPAGRYIYYAGREANFYNNCFIFKSQEDTREAWADLMYETVSATMCGGGVGNDYSIFRPRGEPLGRTGGEASGPVPLMMMVNDNGRYVMQGGSRRTANYASLNWQHGDVHEFLHAKDWEHQFIKGAFNEDGEPMTVKMAKEADFNYKAPLDMTNISVNYDDHWRELMYRSEHPIYVDNVRQACLHGEPGFSFNFGKHSNETGRNACTEVTSEDNGDVCNIGSCNMANIDTIEEFEKVVRLGTIFLCCGLLEADLPSDLIKEVRAKNNRIGLGLMGVHEWLLKRGYRYEFVNELREWMEVYERVSTETATKFCNYMGIPVPVAIRSIAPTGSIGLLAGTTTGIEPIYATAYKRRFLSGGSTWNYQYCLDATAKCIVDSGVDPTSIETASQLALEPRRRIEFQANMQDYVDMAISSTLNLPAWGTEGNNESTVQELADILSEFAPRLRGITFYPDGSRGGQPITEIPWGEAKWLEGETYIEGNDPCNGGSCGS